MQCFRDLAGHSGDRPAVIQLRCQHPRLHMAGEHGEQRQHQQQDQRKAGILHGDDRMMERMRQASATMLMMPEVNSASTVSTSPEKRAATSPGFCLPACWRKLGQLPDISERRAWVIFWPKSTSRPSCAEESIPSSARLPK